ncbi:sigma-70 family RNA polymerase sigma factor [Mesorhizobium abyssinicae]|uniref:sigma-70 family RNA polymerase sigma factor n=1 Tax=Mesorhizobium abyssinicae TaxID=1209958 RepID=UPI00339687DB
METVLERISFETTTSKPSLSDIPPSTSHWQRRPVIHERAERREQFVRVIPARKGGLLSSEEELSLFHRWRDGGDDGALHTLVLAHEPLVASIVGGLRRNGAPVEDAKQEARCGLLEAARHFDPKKGFRFGTYARWWVLSAVSAYAAANRDVLSSRRTKRIQKVLPLNIVSLDAPITPDRISLAELIPSDEAPPDLIVEESIDGERTERSLADALNALDPRERQIVRRRHLSEEPDTLLTLAKDMQITAERVRQIEKAALARLRDILISYRTAGVAGNVFRHAGSRSRRTA